MGYIRVLNHLLYNHLLISWDIQTALCLRVRWALQLQHRGPAFAEFHFHISVAAQVGWWWVWLEWWRWEMEMNLSNVYKVGPY